MAQDSHKPGQRTATRTRLTTRRRQKGTRFPVRPEPVEGQVATSEYVARGNPCFDGLSTNGLAATFAIP